jgi:hypothetical protein
MAGVYRARGCATAMSTVAMEPMSLDRNVMVSVVCRWTDCLGVTYFDCWLHILVAAWHALCVTDVRASTHCTDVQFGCALTGVCIPIEYRCDGQYDCPPVGDDTLDVSDEHKCELRRLQPVLGMLILYRSHSTSSCLMPTEPSIV